MGYAAGTNQNDFVHVLGDHRHQPAGTNEIATATNTDDDIDMFQGGNDTVFAGGGDDAIVMGGTLTAADRLHGGDGFDFVVIEGQYAGLRLGKNTLAEIEGMVLMTSHTVGVSYGYHLTLPDTLIPADTTFTIYGRDLNASEQMYVDASAVVDGTLNITAGAGDDTILGSSFQNVFDMTRGGTDHVTGGRGFDTFNFGNSFDQSDSIDGNGSGDTLIMSAATPLSLTLGTPTIRGVETIRMTAGTFTLVTADNLVAAGVTMRIDGQTATATDPLSFDGSAEKNGSFWIHGTPGNDTLIGGKESDLLFGYGGKDILNGGPGADTIYYEDVSYSTGPNYDVVVGFDFADVDHMDTFWAPDAFDNPINRGRLSTATFDTNLADATATKLHAGDGVLFTPSKGTLAGHLFLVIDVNDVPGYQAGADFVIELVNPHNLNSIDRYDFTAV